MATNAQILAAQGIYDGENSARSLPQRKGTLAEQQYLQDPRLSPFFGPQDSGSGSVNLGSGSGYGWLDYNMVPGAERFANQPSAGVSGGGDENIAEWLSEQGMQIYERPEASGWLTRGIVDAQGNFVGEPQRMRIGEDKAFWNAALLAAAVAGSSAAGLGGGGGASASVGANTAEQISMMAANGMTDSQIASVLAAGGNNAGAATLTGAGFNGATSGLGGYWSGAGVSGAQSTGGSSSLLGGSESGMLGLNTKDWLQIGQLGAGLWAADKAQDSADAYAQQSGDYAREMLAFSKQQYADNLPYVKAAQEKSLAVSDAMLKSQKQSDELAADYANYNKTTFRPLEQSMVADAQGYDTPERRQAAADAAIAETNSAFARSREARARELAANGINPGSGRAMAALDGIDVSQAGAASTAAYNARKGVEDTGYARKVNAVSLGRNLPANQVSSANAALNAGASAVNTSVSGANAGATNQQLMQSAYSGAGSLSSAAGALAQRAGEAQNQLWSSLGNTAGRYITSDKNMKTDIEDADPDEALEEVTATPVSTWKFDPAKMAAAGIPMDDGEENTGPMAQDVNAQMGESAAPGGKKINVGTLIGKTMLAVQSLDRKVNSLAQRIGAGDMVAA